MRSEGPEVSFLPFLIRSLSGGELTPLSNKAARCRRLPGHEVRTRGSLKIIQLKLLETSGAVCSSLLTDPTPCLVASRKRFRRLYATRTRGREWGRRSRNHTSLPCVSIVFVDFRFTRVLPNTRAFIYTVHTLHPPLFRPSKYSKSQRSTARYTDTKRVHQKTIGNPRSSRPRLMLHDVASVVGIGAR